MRLKHTYLSLLTVTLLLSSSVTTARDIWSGEMWDQGKGFWKTLVSAPWHAGVAGGVSMARISGYEDGTSSFVYIGREISYRVYAEAGYMGLGTFEVENITNTEAEIGGFFVALAGTSLPVEKYNITFTGRIAAYRYSTDALISGATSNDFDSGTVPMFTFGMEWRGFEALGVTAELMSVSDVLDNGWVNSATVGIKAHF
ncbi:MAG: hypothetical protein JKY67_19445 [Pseudomonadales bacterium]|nr:hypothetical protein [Pseudomonadales bacterium]